MVVSDNGEELLSEDFKEWLTAHGCYKSDKALYSPRSNGLAERVVQTFKRSLKFSTKTLDVLWEPILIQYSEVNLT